MAPWTPHGCDLLTGTVSLSIHAAVSVTVASGCGHATESTWVLASVLCSVKDNSVVGQVELFWSIVFIIF